MKIEIEDRKMWQDFIEKARIEITKQRSEADKKYEDAWRSVPKLFGMFDRKRAGKKPPPAGTMFDRLYPTDLGGTSLWIMGKIEEALKTKGTAMIIVEYSDLRFITKWIEP